MRKFWLVIGVALLLLVVGGVGLFFRMQSANEEVALELRSNPSGERAQIVMLLSYADRTLPVNYLRENDQVFIGVDGPWWREFDRGAVPVTMLIQGQTLTGTAATARDDQAYVDEIFARLRPTAPAWLPDWLNGVLVVINLEQ